MGIPSYFSHIIREHRNILKKFSTFDVGVSNLYLDCNSLIYDAAHEINNDEDNINKKNSDKDNKIIKSVCNKLTALFKLIKPIKKIFIAFDGVAPVAKLNQQRSRRYKSWFQESFLDEYDTDEKNKIQNKWDTIVITPGTQFMNKLGKKIADTFKDAKKYNVENIMVSTSNSNGEGEHKIYEYIRNNKEYHKNTNTVIYGLDADLIMLTLNHLHIAPKMYLFRETPHFIKSIDSTLNPNDNYLLDIPLLSNTLSFELNNNKIPTTMQEKNKIFDYIFLCFFLGNDFLPHFPALNIRTKGINRLMNAYIHEVGSKNQNILDNYNENIKINWKNLRKVIVNLSNYELEYIKDDYKIRKIWKKSLKNHSGTMLEELMMVPLKDMSIEYYINPYSKGWEYRYYKELFDLSITDEHKKNICMNYLQGLEWVMKYYTNGCADWRWTYNYDYPPLLIDLIKYIPMFDTIFFKKTESKAVTPHVQLSYVLPRNKLDLLPKNIFEKLIAKLEKLYSTDCEFKWAFCRYFWECHPVLPTIKIEWLEEICN